MTTIDKLSPELRKIEKEIDNYYKSNPLVQLPFATAAWCLLAYAEEYMLKQEANYSLTVQEHAVLCENFVKGVAYPMYWLHSACVPGGQVSTVKRIDTYRASRKLFELGQEYALFDAVFTYASRDWLNLELRGETIEVTDDFSEGNVYEAYNALIQPHGFVEPLLAMSADIRPENAIQESLKIQDDGFKYRLNPQMVSYAMMAMKPRYDIVFSLPSEWEFNRYTLGDFRSAFVAISAIAYIHWMARRMAIERGCRDLGHADSIYVPSCGELLRRVERYSGISESRVSAILDDLTYGNRQISNPDPALQPLVKLNLEIYAVMPRLWLSSSPERNLTVLLNKLPSERAIYSQLVSQKEALMRERITTSLTNGGFRMVNGTITGLPDLDLAIIMDSEKTCLLLELKWFIEPGTPREVVEKSEEIEKGICQMRTLKLAIVNNHQPLLEKLNISANYTVAGVVVSDNWIGYSNVQSPEIPVIRADHLTAKLRTKKGLQSAIKWLEDRKYLPMKGRHFEIAETTATIGNWTVNWSATKPIISDAFFPL